jgi:hypothetical protein
MIKSNPLAVALVSALFLSALASCWSAAWWFLGAREAQALEYKYQAMTRTSSAVQSLVSESLEYSRRNPAMNSLLDQFNLRPGAPASAPVAAPANQPASKPSR